MSAGAPAFPWWTEELPVPTLKFVQILPLMVVRLGNRCSGTAYWLATFIAMRAAEQDPYKNPGEVEVKITMGDLRRGCRKSKRSIEYAIEEIGPTHEIENPKRREKVRRETGLETVGKNFVSIRADKHRPGEWFCKLLPANWIQGPGNSPAARW